MTKTKKERLDDALTSLLRVGQIKACGIVSKEGLLINSRTPPDVDARIFSALCSTIMGAAEAASGQMSTGTVSQISVKTEKRNYSTYSCRYKGHINCVNRTRCSDWTYLLRNGNKGRSS